MNFVLLNDTEKMRILEWRNSKVINRWSLSQHIITKKEHEVFIENLKTEKSKFYWLVKRKGIEVGVTNLHKYSEVNKVAEWGFYLKPDYVGRGIGLEVEHYCLNLFFDIFDIRLLQGQILDENIEAMRIQSLFGFKVVSSCKKEIGEKWYNIKMMELTSRKWRSLPESFEDFRRKIILVNG